MFGLEAPNVGTWQKRGLVRAATQMASLKHLVHYHHDDENYKDNDNEEEEGYYGSTQKKLQNDLGIFPDGGNFVIFLLLKFWGDLRGILG